MKKIIKVMFFFCLKKKRKTKKELFIFEMIATWSGYKITIFYEIIILNVYLFNILKKICNMD